MLETACPSDDLLGAHVGHALEEHEASRIASHLDSCESCRQVVIAAVRDNATPKDFPRGTPSLSPLNTHSRSLAGTRMGRYELRGLLGAGGMGQVYTAYDAELDREIALKVLHPELARGAAKLADRLVRESRLMAKVAHPSVITVYDVGRTDDDAVFIAMELVRGETLGAYLARTKPGWSTVMALFERAGAGLAAAHGAGIVHRDFKPDNVLVEGDATKVVVTDFGIAMDAIAYASDLTSAAVTAPNGLALGTDRVVRLTATGAAIGTPAYMAPEQLAADDVDARADVFAFCVSLWEALYGERPFRGKTVEELRTAMAARPRAPRTAVPNRLVRALERGLAIAPADRWPDMPSLLRELAAVRGQWRRTLMGFGAAGLVGAGIAGALLLAGGGDRVDPCAASLPDTHGLALDAATTAELAKLVDGWRTTQAATCKRDAEPPQAPAVATCLDARRTEIEAFVEEARRSGTRAAPLIKTIVPPARCTDPRAGMLVARAPTDRAQRIAVAELRYRSFAIEDARDRSEFATAVPAAQKLVDDSVGAWPQFRAEALYLLGTTQSMAGDSKRSLLTLREAAAVAERVHHDYIAVNTWIQLIQATTFDEGDPTRALEYATYADAALDRIGRPPEIEVLFLYYKGTTLVEVGHPADALPLLERAVMLSKASAPQLLSQALLGLGHTFEGLGKFSDATSTFREALSRTSPGDPAEHTFHERLAMNLAFLGETDEAEVEVRKAIAIVDRQLGEDSTDRAVTHSTLAQVLQKAHKLEAALAEARVATKMLEKSLGVRNPRFGELMSLEAQILIEMERWADADALLARACEILAFGYGDENATYADCLLSRATTLGNLEKVPDAIAMLDRALPILIRTDGDAGARTANAYLLRAEFRETSGKPADAIPDVEHAIAIYEKLQLDTGHLAAAKYFLADLLGATDPARARTLAAEAMTLFATASTSWGDIKAETEAWIRKHP